MKTRLGFVSNSSSSSYVVALKTKEKPCVHCGRSDSNFFDIVEAIGARSRDDFEITQLHERGLDQLQRYVDKLNEDVWREKKEIEWWEEILEYAKKAVEKGYDVARIEMSYHDDVTNDLFRELETRKVVVVLWSDHRDIILNKIEL